MSIKLVKDFFYQTNVLLILVVLKFFVRCNKKQPGLVYILEWTSVEDWQYLYLELGQEAFTKRNCSFQNCFLTTNRTYFGNVLDFDVLLFNVLHLDLNISDPPIIRSQSQLYVLVSLEPALYHPISPKFNGIFNMTWSYKLTAGIIYPYLLVANKRGEVIGPRKDMHWEYDVKDMAPTNNDTIFKLRYKNIAAAAVISNCHALSGRYEFITRLKEELLKYGQQVDVYGHCALNNLACERQSKQRNGLITNCVPKIESDYYFYLAFENSFSEDYVSEKVLHGLNHFAVPVVYGGANYTRFLPDGIYLNAYTLGVKKLAKEMNSIINNPQRYIEFFKWHGYYTFYDTYGLEYNDTYTVCNICANLNKRIQGNKKIVYVNITSWWNVLGAHNQSKPVSITSTTPYDKNEQSDYNSILSRVISNLYDIMYNNNNV